MLEAHSLELKKMSLELEKRNKEFSHSTAMVEEQNRLDKAKSDLHLEKIKARLDEESHKRKENLSNLSHSQAIRERNGEGVVTTLKFGAAVLTVAGAGIMAYSKYSK